MRSVKTKPCGLVECRTYHCHLYYNTPQSCPLECPVLLDYTESWRVLGVYSPEHLHGFMMFHDPPSTDIVVLNRHTGEHSLTVKGQCLPRTIAVAKNMVVPYN